MDKIRKTEYRGCTVTGPSNRYGDTVSFSVLCGDQRWDVDMTRRGPLEIMKMIRATVARMQPVQE